MSDYPFAVPLPLPDIYSGHASLDRKYKIQLSVKRSRRQRPQNINNSPIYSSSNSINQFSSTNNLYQHEQSKKKNEKHQCICKKPCCRVFLQLLLLVGVGAAIVFIMFGLISPTWLEITVTSEGKGEGLKVSGVKFTDWNRTFYYNRTRGLFLICITSPPSGVLESFILRLFLYTYLQNITMIL